MTNSRGLAINYYERHLGDFARDTAHLSALEVGVYDLLLDRYYATEKPIQESMVYRVARATSRAERVAVDAVLSEFFELEDGVYRQRRADAEIVRFQQAEPQREAKRENAKERQRRARDRRADLFEALRGHGIVPPYDTATGDLVAQLSRVESRAEGKKVTPKETAPVTPVTRDITATSPQTPDIKANTPNGVLARKRPVTALGEDFLTAKGVDPQHAKDWMAVRAKHRAPLTETAWAAIEREAHYAGITPAEAVRVSAERGWRGFEAAWYRNAQQSATSGRVTPMRPAPADRAAYEAQTNAEAKRLLGFS